jgi:hypothetical protein
LLRPVAEALAALHGAGAPHGGLKPSKIVLQDDDSAYLLAPNQHGTPQPDIPTDVSALAATLYFAVSGIEPARGAAFRPPLQLVASLTRRFDRALCQALHGEPGQRPISCPALFMALDPEPPQVSSMNVPSPSERRSAPRYSTDLRASCRPLLDQKSRWQGEVEDISLRGLRLVLDRRFEPGVLLNIEVHDNNGEAIHGWLVQVRWVRELVARKWAIGCAFNRDLSAEDLRLLLDLRHTATLVEAVA